MKSKKEKNKEIEIEIEGNLEDLLTEEELKQVPGEFTPSPFVKKITGVDNVCERSAVLASGNGRLLQRKTGENGVTTAVVAREWRIHFE